MALFTGVTCDIWIQPGKLPTQGELYRKKVCFLRSKGCTADVLAALELTFSVEVHELHNVAALGS